jgi:toxin ParE1/3/4
MVRIEYHPAVGQDVADALRRYDPVSRRLGDEFERELRQTIAAVAVNPRRFHPVKPGFRRANLKRFPYHFIYRELADGIRIILVRHHRRDPKFGMERQ